MTTDIIGKLIELADGDDGKAKLFSAKVIAAQSKGISTDGVKQMQQIENELLDTAVEFELIDSVGKRELERIREDRNLCVHPRCGHSGMFTNLGPSRHEPTWRSH